MERHRLEYQSITGAMVAVEEAMIVPPMAVVTEVEEGIEDIGN